MVKPIRSHNDAYASIELRPYWTVGVVSLTSRCLATQTLLRRSSVNLIVVATKKTSTGKKKEHPTTANAHQAEKPINLNRATEGIQASGDLLNGRF